MSDIRLDHVVIAVSDWEHANAFYRDVCGAELVRVDEPPPTYWRYRFGDQQLNVHGPGMHPAPVARVTTAPGSADLCLLWPGPIEQAAEHLRAHGVEVEEGPIARDGARGTGTSVYFRDPDSWLSTVNHINRKTRLVGRAFENVITLVLCDSAEVHGCVAPVALDLDGGDVSEGDEHGLLDP